MQYLAVTSKKKLCIDRFFACAPKYYIIGSICPLIPSVKSQSHCVEREQQHKSQIDRYVSLLYFDPYHIKMYLQDSINTTQSAPLML